MKTNFGRKLSRRGKIGLALLVTAMFISVASAALLPHFGKITTTATVEQAVDLGEITGGDIVWHPYNNPIEHTILEEVPGGETFCFKQLIRNRASTPVDVQFDTSYWPLLTDEEITTTYITKITDDNTNFGSRVNEAVAFSITSGLTLDDLFADDGLLYTYTILDGGVYDGASPIIAMIDLEDGRHIALFPGWGTRTETYTLQFSDTVAYDSGGNNYVDFALYPNDFSVWLYGSVSCGYGNFTAIKADTDLIDGTEVVTRIAIQHQAANTGETDKLDSLTFGAITYEFAITDGTPFTLYPGEKILFYICYGFDILIGPDDYTITTTINTVR